MPQMDAGMTLRSIGLPLGLLLLCAGAAEAKGDVTRTPGTRGYVVSHLWHALGSAGPEACPQGFALAPTQEYLNRLPPGSEKARLSQVDHLRQLIFGPASESPDGQNLCAKPTLVADPGLRTVAGTGPAPGLPLDLPPAPPRCVQPRFAGEHGEPAIDNQLYRVLGCIRGYQPGDAAEGYQADSYKAGGRTLLIEVNGLDDLRNDPELEIVLELSIDKPPFAATGVALAHASLRASDRVEERVRMQGHLVDGVLTTDPVDLPLPSEQRGKRLRLADKATPPDVLLPADILSARLRLEVQPDGSLKGILAGYVGLAEFYKTASMQGMGAATDRYSKGRAFNFGYTCPGLFHALQRFADGFPDASGTCTAISAAFRVEAVPAFVIHGEAQTAAAP